jgi:predicted DNA-binding protein (UPF0278 family)
METAHVIRASKRVVQSEAGILTAANELGTLLLQFSDALKMLKSWIRALRPQLKSPLSAQ